MPQHVEGSVVSVNKSANTVVIKDTKGKQFNLVADNDTAAELSRLKAGDQVEVTYKKSKDQMVATKINLTGSPNTSRTKYPSRRRASREDETVMVSPSRHRHAW